MYDPALRKAVLRLLSYGLYAVTCRYGEEVNVFTANWLSQVSFDPPLLAVSIENESFSLPLILASGLFAVHVLESNQRDLAARFGKPHAHVGPKLDPDALTLSARGLPLLPETLGALECSVESSLPAGDSMLVVGRLQQVHQFREGEPLTMKAAGFRHSG